jgi:glutamate racemase
MTTRASIPPISSRPIGVFDSGIGGLTVVRALTHHLPHENIVYFGDTARVPYGPKSPQVVREYSVQDTEFLMSHDVKMIVVAATKNGRVGVIGTVGTIASNAYVNAIRLIDPAVTVFAQACPLFVPLAEEGWTEHPATELIVKEYLFQIKRERIDTLVLGCTHYPILAGVISKFLGDSVTLIDSGEAAARDVGETLGPSGLGNPSSAKPHIQFFVSDIPHKFAEVGERFLGHKLGRIRRAEGF